MIDLSVQYMGLGLNSPLVVSSSPLSENIDNLRRMEDAGAAAVVLHSVFEEQIALEEELLERGLTQGTKSFAEALTYFPDLGEYPLGPQEYLEHLRKAKSAVAIPVIGSLNCVTTGGWIDYARKIEETGADGLELNIYDIPTDPNVSGEQVEESHVDLVRQVAASVEIPVAVKLAPYFSAMANMAHRLGAAGADALVLFNRFYQPDFDLENLEVVPNLVLSTSHELRLRLRWTAILYGRVSTDLAVTGGIHTVEDIVKALMAGANVTMMASTLLTEGIEQLGTLRNGLTSWLETHEYESVRQMQGAMSLRSVADSAAFERANYLKVLQSFSRTESAG